ncbi:MAG: periplasmic heavy metal sensor [Chthoniobacteraceae bacterium]
MKHKLIPSLVLAALSVGALHQRGAAEEPSRAAVAHGIVFLPLDFYPKHREALGLSEEQVREMHGIAEGMRAPAEKIEAEIRERTKALHEAVGQNPVDREKVMHSFERVLQAENEMKMLQFRTRIAMRSQLTPEQYAKVAALVKHGAKKESGARDGASEGGIHEPLQKVREQLRKRAGGGDLPRDVVEKLEQIEQMAKQGRVDEAREQLEGILRHLRDESSSARPPEGKRPDGAPQAGGEELKKRIHRIAEAAEQTDNAEVRERLQDAVRRLREAAESGNREVVDDIMRSVEPMLPERAKRKE